MIFSSEWERAIDKFFDQEITRRIEHLPLAERKLLIALQNEKIAQYFCDLEDRSGFDFFGVFAIAAVPGLLIRFDFFLTQHLVDLHDHGAIDDFAQTHRFDVVDRNHYFHIGFENSQHVKPFFRARYDVAANRFNLTHAMRGINDLLTYLEHRHLLLSRSLSAFLKELCRIGLVKLSKDLNDESSDC